MQWTRPNDIKIKHRPQSIALDMHVRKQNNNLWEYRKQIGRKHKKKKQLGYVLM